MMHILYTFGKDDVNFNITMLQMQIKVIVWLCGLFRHCQAMLRDADYAL